MHTETDKNKGGRPKKETKLKSRQVPLLDADYELLKQFAKPDSFGAWARKTLLQAGFMEAGK